VNVALLGCGAVTYYCHLPALKRIPGVSVVAAADPDPQSLARIAGAARLSLHERPEDVLARDDVDAVIIAVPTHLHAEAAVAAAAAGKHFYLEKPVADDAPGAARVADAAARAGVVAAVGFNRRLHPLYEQARALVRAGRLGRVLLGQSAHCEPALGAAPSSWRQARATGGGVLLDLASHHVDLLRWLLDDEPVEIGATLRSELSEHDSARVQIVTRGGVWVQSVFSFRAGLADYLELIGERGTLRVDRHQASLTLRVPRRFGYGTRHAWVAPSRAAIRARVRRLSHPAEDPSYHRALRAFVQRVRTGTGPTASIDDGVRSLDAVLAAEESARLGAPVSLPTR
jgi:myo-inositol 2-dehydrogenase / D-chiro-inositol 1-dehydrogenase